MGVVARQPAHGYEVKSRIDDLLGGSWDVNIGQVYATLQRLERDGLVEAVGDRGDRGKRVYRLTAAGHEELGAWLERPDQEPPRLREEMFIKVMVGAHLRTDRLEDLLTQQRRVYLQILRNLAQMEQGARRDGRPDLALLAKGAVVHTKADLEWLDACLDELPQLRRNGGAKER